MSYEPTGVDVAGVVIGASEGVVVTIVNDFSGVQVKIAPMTVTKTVVPVDGVAVPTSFSATVRCDDGTDADVLLPGAGGTGAPVLDVRVLSVCHVMEVAESLPDGGIVTYSLNGGPPSASPPTFAVRDTTAIVVAITNDPTNAAPPDPAPPDPAPPGAGEGPGPEDTGTTTGSGAVAAGAETLPATGAANRTLLLIGLACLVTGCAVAVRSRRHRTP